MSNQMMGCRGVCIVMNANTLAEEEDSVCLPSFLHSKLVCLSANRQIGSLSVLSSR